MVLSVLDLLLDKDHSTQTTWADASMTPLLAF